MKENSIVVQGICYDLKSSFQKGPAKAPPLIRERFYSDAYNMFAENGKEIAKDTIDDKGDHLIDDYWDIYHLTKKNVVNKHKILTLGGDHSITYPVVKAISEVWGKVHILHLDAHGDLYDEFEGDKYSHACPFARIMEDGLACKLTQIGIRTLNSHQRDQVNKYNVEVIEMKDFSEEKIPHFTEPVYVSLDIDAFDPAFAPGVSHQESGGLTPREVLRIFSKIAGPIIGADIVEFNPQNDHSGITAALCGKMMKELLAKM